MRTTAEKTNSLPVHGGLNYAELQSIGLCPEDVLDFSASINPLGTAPGVSEAVQRVPADIYPDPSCLQLRRALGSHLGIEPGSILVGNGSTELIHLIARAFLSYGDTVVIFAPTFAEYEAACRLQSVTPVFISSKKDEGFRWDMPKALNIIADQKAAAVFVCNPNNPTGIHLKEQEVRQIAETMDKCGLLVLDEAYRSFVDECWPSHPLLCMENVLLLRSMTKDYALAGLRLGYMLASDAIVRQVGQYQYSWSVNAPAQAAGIAALSQQEHVELGRQMVVASKKFLRSALSVIGLECIPSTANFLMIRVGEAARIRLELLKKYKICVRDCGSFGLPDYIRVGVRNMQDSRQLVQALKEVVSDKDG